MRAVRLALFAIVGLVVALGGLALALGWRPSNGTPAAPVAQPVAETLPTMQAEPTLTTDERTKAQDIDTRATSMIKAARDLQTLGQEIRATVAWKGRVRAAVAIITGEQKTIQGSALPDRFGPLNTRAKAATDGCAASVTSLPSVDVLTVASVAAISPELERCVTDLERLQLSISGL